MDKTTLKVVSLMTTRFFRWHKTLLDCFKDIDQEKDQTEMHVHYNLISFNIHNFLELEEEINEAIALRENLEQCRHDEELEIMRQQIISVMTSLTTNHKIICDMSPAELKQWIIQQKPALKS